ncbi:hypothetical protein C8N40_102251 [Pontibacter mucosus]|uniref:Uncharacterized protein n=1 Tax=Pontibacter mucosus TaxID=1649266 RepID=A0A2T5YPQ3_9BACT|nr:hypothetical protein C8N40_102251 [Pontibacter mucosus]
MYSNRLWQHHSLGYFTHQYGTTASGVLLLLLLHVLKLHLPNFSGLAGFMLRAIAQTAIALQQSLNRCC